MKKLAILLSLLFIFICSCGMPIESSSSVSYDLSGNWKYDYDYQEEKVTQYWYFGYNTFSNTEGRGYDSGDNFKFSVTEENGNHVVTISWDKLEAFVEYEYEIKDNTLYLYQYGELVKILEKA